MFRRVFNGARVFENGLPEDEEFSSLARVGREGFDCFKLGEKTMEVLARDLEALLKIAKNAHKNQRDSFSPIRSDFSWVLVDKGFLWATDKARLLKIPIGGWGENLDRSYMTIEKVKEVLNRKLGRLGAMQDIAGGRLHCVSFDESDVTPVPGYGVTYPDLDPLLKDKIHKWTTFEKADRDAFYKAIEATRLKVIEFHWLGEGHELLYAHHSAAGPSGTSTAGEELRLKHRALYLQLHQHAYNTTYFKELKGLGFDQIAFLGGAASSKVRLRNSLTNKESLLVGVLLKERSRNSDFSWE